MLDFLKKPETIMVKEGWESKEYLEILKTQKPTEEIQKEIELMEKQVRLEEKIQAILKEGRENYVVIKDVNFSVFDVKVHLDYYIITPKLIYILECKSWDNPLERAEKNMNLLRDRKVMNADGVTAVSLQANFHDYYRTIVISENPKECKEQWTKAEESWVHVVKPENLLDTMERWNRKNSLRRLPKKRMIQNAQKMLEYYKDEPFMYDERFIKVAPTEETTEKAEPPKDDKFLFSMRSE